MYFDEIHNVYTRVKRLLTLNPKERRHLLVGPAEIWELKREFQMTFLSDVGLSPQDHLLDLGCGTLRGGIPLVEYLLEGHYVGIDSRGDALLSGYRELTEYNLLHKKPLLILGNTSTTYIGRKFDVIWAFSVLFHMDDETLDKSMKFVHQHLTCNGVMYGNVKIGKHENTSWSEFPVVWRSFDEYRYICEKNDLTVDDIGSLSDFGHDSGDDSQDDQRMLRFQSK